jgi:hypothetical protein
MVVPGLVIGLSASTGDNGPTPAEPLSADKPSGLRKPSPKLGFFDSVCVPVYQTFLLFLLQFHLRQMKNLLSRNDTHISWFCECRHKQWQAHSQFLQHASHSPTLQGKHSKP